MAASPVADVHPAADNRAMPTARLARFTDWPSLLALFAVSETSRSIGDRAQAERVWRETLAQPGVSVFV